MTTHTETPVTRDNLKEFTLFKMTRDDYNYAPKGGIYALDYDDGSTCPRFVWVSGPTNSWRGVVYINLDDLVGLSTPTSEDNNTPVTRANLYQFTRFRFADSESPDSSRYTEAGGYFELDFDDGTAVPYFRWVDAAGSRSEYGTYIALRRLVGLPPQTQETKQPMTTTKIVSFTMVYNGDEYISLIKCFRSATGTGLKEAKDVVDAARCLNGNYSGAKNVRLTDKQFGLFVANVLADIRVSLADVRMDSVTISSDEPLAFDFTKLAA